MRGTMMVGRVVGIAITAEWAVLGMMIMPRSDRTARISQRCFFISYLELTGNRIP
jgi:hypothetical protein